MTVTILSTRQARLQALGLMSWPERERRQQKESLQLINAPRQTKWLFLLGSDKALEQDSPEQILFAGILRALGESQDTVAWGGIHTQCEPQHLAARFPALKTIVLLGEELSPFFAPVGERTQVQKILSWNKFRVIVSASLATLQVQTDAKRWLWQQLQLAMSVEK